MKKTLILALMVTLTTGCAFATTTDQFKLFPEKKAPTATQVITPEKTNCIEHKKDDFAKQHKKHKAEFEKRLNLTEEQKAQAKELHKKGFEEMKPIMEQILNLKKQKEAVKLSRIAVIEQEKRIAEIDLQLRALKKQAREMRAKNFKEFESILTKQQKKELKKMKKEGRKNFEEKKKQCSKETKCDCPMIPPKAYVEK